MTQDQFMAMHVPERVAFLQGAAWVLEAFENHMMGVWPKSDYERAYQKIEAAFTELEHLVGATIPRVTLTERTA